MVRGQPHRHRRMSRSSEKRKSYKSLAIVIILLIFFIGGFWSIRETEKHASIDPVTYCDQSHVPAVTLVLVDASDALDVVQIERVTADLLHTMAESPERSRIDIYAARADGTRLIEPLFSKCNPGRAGSAVTSNAKGDALKFREGYLQAIEQAFSSALGEKEAGTSPILESIREAAVQSFARESVRTQKKVIIVSDMLQNSAVYSQYLRVEPFKQFSKSPARSQTLVDLTDADVSIKYITRAKYRKFQGIAHQTWWHDYFIAANVRKHDVKIESY